LWFDASPLRPYLKKPITKRAGITKSGKRTCLGNVRPQVKNSVPPKKKKKAQGAKIKTDKWDYTKLRSFCIANDTIKNEEVTCRME
jgi:hypothetical protein